MPGRDFNSRGALMHRVQLLLSGEACWPRAWEHWHGGSLGLQRYRLYPLWDSNPGPMAHKAIVLTTELREAKYTCTSF